MKRILVTGASGFIGDHLVNGLLRERGIVRVLLHRDSRRDAWPGNVEVVRGDIRDVREMKTAATGCDTVFHLAGRAHALSEVHSDEALYQSVNVEGTRNILESAIAGGVRSVVFFSSVKAMGENSAECLDEIHEPRPTTAYGRSKLAAEEMVFDYGKRTGLHVVCLRLSMVYGPGNKGNLFRMISAIDHGRFPSLPDVGNRRSMVHVSNVVDAAMLAPTYSVANGQCYIVTDGRPYSTTELYEMIVRGLGKPVPRRRVPIGMLKGLALVGDVVGRLRGRRFVFDSDAFEKLMGDAWYSSKKISRELGYRPRVTFEDALPDMIAWYRMTQARPTC
ncbi:MAG: NAD-dependent epimerase/dehydratase family protein [Nitrospirota bacterium]